MCCCSWWTFWTLSLNTEMAADIRHWKLKHLNCWWKSCAKFDSLLLNIYVLLFMLCFACSLEKVNFEVKTVVQVYWTTCVILIKLAGYLAWILICKHCKFGEKICYNSRDIEFFLGDYFFWCTPPCMPRIPQSHRQTDWRTDWRLTR